MRSDFEGEANVYQENLDSFLRIAEDLKLKGLTGQQDVNEKMMKPNQREIGPHATFKNEELISNTGKSHFVLAGYVHFRIESRENTVSSKLCS